MLPFNPFSNLSISSQQYPRKIYVARSSWYLRYHLDLRGNSRESLREINGNISMKTNWKIPLFRSLAWLLVLERTGSLLFVSSSSGIGSPLRGSSLVERLPCDLVILSQRLTWGKEDKPDKISKEKKKNIKNWNLILSN